MSENVIYITIDSIRGDRVGYLGYEGNTTPEIDNLAADGLTFKHSIANGIPTYYSFKSLLGGIHSLSHSRSIGLPETATHIAEVFQDAGYDTAGFNAKNPWLTPNYGYNRGFDTFEDFTGGSSSSFNFSKTIQETKRAAKRAVAFSETLTDKLGQLGRIGSAIIGSQPLVQAERLTEATTNWIDSRDDDRPFFLWVHYMDPHYPWVPPEEFLGEDIQNLSRIDIGRLWHTVAYQYQRQNATIDAQTIRRVNQLYDAEVRRMDASIGRLIETVKSTSGATLIALAGDHGTELYDHGGFSHGPRSLYQEVVRVPLIFAGPNIPNEHREIGSLVDIPKTLVEHAEGVEEPVDAFEGINLIESRDEHAVTEVVYDIDPTRQQNTNNDLLLSCIHPPWKLIRNDETGDIELYDLETDPQEQSNVASEHPKIVSELSRNMKYHRKRIQRRNRTMREKQRVRHVISELRREGEI